MPSISTLRRDLALFAKYHLWHPVENHPAREGALGLAPLPFDLAEHLARLRAFEGPRFEVREEASLLYQGRAHPMLSVSSRAPADKTLLVIAGIHGNEHAGLLAVPRILEKYDSPTRLVVLSPANPVGAAAMSRYNADGYDINRDFVQFETEEARVVRSLYDRVRPDFVVSLHEGPQDATFMFANRFVSMALARRCLAALESEGTVLADKDYFGLRLKPPGYSGSSRLARGVNRLWAASLGMMASIAYSEGRGIPELVLESAWRNPDLEARVQPHVTLTRVLLEALAPPLA
ncbi:MAG: succinylglutamate desuccinylase/aspartoacylase family protein [Sandaracinaceae bacterium]